ncbi:unnamed protein product [Soboliphyme baturini]|uniref:Fanconi anemia group I protein n=1 Tax=Soboliphyme baturini TaxID=241478 RepID=A0A183IQM1_9BILA|nr:unnamed protein product [Soboliphyme baturini]
MITRNDAEKWLVEQFENCGNKKELISKILENISLTNLWVSQMDLQLLLKQVQVSHNQEYVHLVDVIAKACMDTFQSQDLVQDLQVGVETEISDQFSMKFSEISPCWLIAPLISRLPSSVQGRVLKAAATVLETSQCASRERSTSYQRYAVLLGFSLPYECFSCLLTQQPFLSLVLTCLSGQDDQRENLLSSLLKQIQEYIAQVKEVGGMFDTVCKTSSLENWALLLLQVLLYGIASEESDRQVEASMI